MRTGVIITVSGTLAMVLGASILSHATWAQTESPQTESPQKGSPDGVAKPPVYNPYPPGILPSDLNSELARVLREVDVIEKRALARWRALTPPTLTGQPPTLQNTGTEAVEILGELMNYDKNISPNNNQACASCHMPYVAFSGPIPSVHTCISALSACRPESEPIRDTRSSSDSPTGSVR